jgi:hypothetical protein
LAKHNYLSQLAREHRLDFIALMEMGRRSFSESTLRYFCGGVDFLWHLMPPRGRSGGMMLGVNPGVYDIGSIDEEIFIVNSDFEIKKMASFGPFLLFMGQLKMT